MDFLIKVMRKKENILIYMPMHILLQKQLSFESFAAAAAAAKLLQSCLTLCDPMDSSPSGSSVHGTLQGRILE